GRRDLAGLAPSARTTHESSPAGPNLGICSLLGLLTLAPHDRTAGAPEGAVWVGPPPIRLPRREPRTAFPDTRTFCPIRFGNGRRFAPRRRLAAHEGRDHSYGHSVDGQSSGQHLEAR